MTGSIRWRLSVMLLAGIASVWAAALATSFRHASREVQTWDDTRLVEFAKLAALLDDEDLLRLTQSHIDARTELPQPSEAAETLSDSDLWPREVLLEVRDARGRTIAASRELTTLGAIPARHENIGRPWSATIAGTAWRLYALQDVSTGRTIAVMETANTRSDLARGAALQITRPLLIALPVLALLVWFAIGRSLAPLRTLSAAIRARDSSRLDPVGINDVPAEVRPLVDAIDRLLSQLKQSIARERAFTSDAAHELKTPLAAIKVQAQLAQSAENPAVRQLAIQRVIQGVDRSARLAEQLLLLARLDENERIPTTPVALHLLARIAVASYRQQAHAKHVEIEYDDTPAPLIEADSLLIGILLDNLLDNAIKYGIAGGHVQLSLLSNDDWVLLVVRDDGPGVDPSEVPRLTDRFFRGTGASASGSGLGLSIVARIVRYFNGMLTFESGIDGVGLAVTVSLPRASTGNAPPSDATPSVVSGDSPQQ